jgi:ACS family hexuronate transporter-like MFS transporter
LRWWIAILLFLSTTINYISRQTLSQSAPILKQSLHFNDQQYGYITFSFMIAYAIMPIFAGRFLDRVGTKLGLSLAVIWWSVVGMLHALAHTVRTFIVMRVLLAMGEGVNWPGATKAVSEWFPASERSLAVGFFDSGSSVGSIVASTAVMGLIFAHGWQSAFLLSGALGFVWLALWLWLYAPWQTHPRLSQRERALIAESHAREERDTPAEPMRWSQLLRFKQVWAIVVGRICSDSVWWFLVFWLTNYLVARGVTHRILLAINWLPYIAADIGNFAGGGASAWLAKHGWSLTRARRAVLLVGGIVMTVTAPGALLPSTSLSITAISIWALFYAGFVTILLAMPSDLFEPRVVGSVAGLTQTGAGAGGAAFQLLAGHVIQHTNSYASLFWLAAALSLIGMVTVLLVIPKIEILRAEPSTAA